MFFYSESDSGTSGGAVALPTSWSESLATYDYYMQNTNQGFKDTAVSGDGSTVFFALAGKNVNGVSIAGEIYVYEKINNIWTKTASITEGTIGSNNRFGYTISTNHDGTVLAVGTANSAAYIFKKINGNWVETDSFVQNGNYGFGIDVSLSGNGMTLAIGDQYNNSGEYHNVYIYENINDSWSLVKTAWGMAGTGTYEYIRPISINYDGSIVVMGSPVADNYADNNRGYAYVFEKNNAWNYQAIPPAVGTLNGGNFGRYVDISSDGTTVAVGAKNATNIFIYKKVDNAWALDSTIPIGTSYAYSGFGNSFAFNSDGSLLAVSAEQDTNYNGGNGRILYYKKVENVWENIYSHQSETLQGVEYYGNNVAMSDNGAVVAAKARKNFFIIEGT